MKQLRYGTAALVIALAVLFNLERLDFGAENLLNIQSFVYVLALAAVVTVIGLPRVQRHAARPALVVGLWLALYAGLKIWVFDGRPFIGGIYTYVTITEAALLVAVTRLALHVARQVHDFEQAVEHITLADADGAIHTLTTAGQDIKNEMLRSRRYNRPMTVTVVEPEPESIRAAVHRTVQEVQRAMMTRYVFTGLARRVRHEMRRIDLVLEEADRGRIVIVSPETTAEHAHRVIDRIRESAESKLGVRVLAGTAAFPDEALTFEELVQRAEDRMDVHANGNAAAHELPLTADIFGEREEARA